MDSRAYVITVRGKDGETLTAKCPRCPVERRHKDVDKLAGMVQAHMISTHNSDSRVRHTVVRRPK